MIKSWRLKNEDKYFRTCKYKTTVEDFYSIYDLTPSFLKLPPPFTQPLLFRAQFLPPPFKPILKKFYPLQYEGGGANYDVPCAV